MPRLNGFLNRVGQLVRSYDGSQVAQHLRFVPSNVRDEVSRAGADIHQTCSEFLDEPWDSIVGSYLASVAQTAGGSNARAYSAAQASSDLCYDIMAGKIALTDPPNGAYPNWYLPIVNCVLYQLRVAAKHSDEGKSGDEKQRETFNFIRGFVKECKKKQRAKGVQSKKMGIIFILNHLFKLCFRMNLLRNTGPLVVMMDDDSFPPLHLFPKSQVVTYKFYMGRLMMIEEKYRESEECLDYSLRHCHKDSKTNKKRILQYLIPVRLLLKKTPHPKLLKKYSFPEFETILQAIRTGNLRGYMECIAKYEEYLIQKGIYLVMEKLKKFVFRNLLKKVHTYALQDNSQPNKKRMWLRTIKAALKVHNYPVDDENFDEIECIVANLIVERLMKGTIFHGKAILIPEGQETVFPK